MVCAFPLPDSAFQAACDMQLAAPDTGPERLAIKIGFTFGPVVLSGGDVFGDTVNVCARLVALANADQVLTTQQTVDALSPMLRARCRQMFPIRVRGRHEEIVACNVMWRTDPDLTEINLTRAAITRTRETVLKLSRQGQVHIVRSAGTGARIGRDKENDVVVDSQFASRVHARVFAREGHFVIVDQSSNGTYLLADGNSAEILLRREEAVLGERGWIGLGNSATRQGDHALRYRVEPEWD
jgi:adenylate cyclase